jgi:tungstate transport system substrate-binding protein
MDEVEIVEVRPQAIAPFEPWRPPARRPMLPKPVALGQQAGVPRRASLPSASRRPPMPALQRPRHVLAALAALILVSGAAGAADPPELLLATTTSVRDSGLLDEILPAFTQQTGIRVKLIAVGSGAALELGRKGDADLVIAHAPEAEQKLVAEGALVSRRPFAENFFLIAGPADDPAHVKSAGSAVEAFARIAAAKAPFATRGDESGTHQRERKLFEQAGLPPDPAWPAVLRTGAGMGQTLEVAGEKRAYVLTDNATFRAFAERTGLVALTGSDPALRNVYSILLVPPERFPAGRIHASEARALADYLVLPATLERIGRFAAGAGGEPLFRPLP